MKTIDIRTNGVVYRFRTAKNDKDQYSWYLADMFNEDASSDEPEATAMSMESSEYFRSEDIAVANLYHVLSLSLFGEGLAEQVKGQV